MSPHATSSNTASTASSVMNSQASSQSFPHSQTTTATHSSQGSLTELLNSTSNGSQPVLRLRGIRPPRRSIRWAEDVVDNEGLGRKSSKVCCIYHPTRAVGESSDESSSSSSSSSESSDSESDAGRQNPRRNGPGAKRKAKRCDHGHDDGHDHHHVHGSDHANLESNSDAAAHRPRRRPSPNAYERIPKPRNKAGGAAMRKGGSGTQTMTEDVKR